MKSNYIFNKTVQINNSLKQQCNALYNECCTKDKLKHPCCFEDEFDMFSDFPRLYYSTFENKLLGFLSVYIISSDCVEISIFVHPDWRQKQIGQTLLNNFLTDYDIENIEISMSPDNTPGTQFLTHNHFQLASTELLMSVRLSSFMEKNTYKSNFKTVFSSNTFQYMLGTDYIGSCHISSLSDTHVFISDVEISENYRNKGIGYQFMCKVFHELAPYFSSASLHVSKENVPAYKLYKKLGFKEMDSTLIYDLHQD